MIYGNRTHSASWSRQHVVKALSGSLAILLLFSSAGCAPSTGGRQPAEIDLTAFAPLDFSKVSFIIRSTDTRGMAGESDVVVTGTVAAWRAGSQVVYEWGDVAIPSMVVELTNIRVISGALDPGTRSVYVGFISAMGPEQLGKTLPTGMMALAYLDEAPKTAPGPDVKNLGAGRPEGAPLWVQSVAEGLALDAGGGRVFWPFLGAVAKGSLEDAMPGGALTPWGNGDR